MPWTRNGKLFPLVESVFGLPGHSTGFPGICVKTAWRGGGDLAVGVCKGVLLCNLFALLHELWLKILKYLIETPVESCWAKTL